MESVVTCRAPVNIAVIKYWGKRDEKRILPINDSLSATLNTDHLCATTSVLAKVEFPADRLWLNGKEELLNTRLQNCLREIRRRAALADKEKKIDWDRVHFHICSVNNFPTAAGLASSAAGYACLVYTLAKAVGFEETFDGELSTIARVGSGSACRSLYGGFVKWVKGETEEGLDSKAVQVVDENHWPEIVILILVVSSHKKDTSSTTGMETTVLTSPLIMHRANEVVPARMVAMEKAIKERDFQTFGKITMQDSNQFHATCLDTYPPIFYMNDTSKTVIHLITKYNQYAGKIKAAYTFDAGPNAVVYLERENLGEFLSLVDHSYPSSLSADKYYPNPETRTALAQSKESSQQLVKDIGFSVYPDTLQYIIQTDVGKGPEVLSADAHLLDAATGMPLGQVSNLS
eukprot:TRINITY_DN8151_c0_g1_i1.p1 TRINITY_DN8151_c0_g1~~TRINITY_DN8151_c0_g1_i1.p1  ORF type:complete len:404 (-),score=77.96 TRINITY_DN8151_c0_g1_i1:242-1453(-)